MINTAVTSTNTIRETVKDPMEAVAIFWKKQWREQDKISQTFGTGPEFISRKLKPAEYKSGQDYKEDRNKCPKNGYIKVHKFKFRLFMKNFII